ncbi:Card1-like endonuclease domain-containing protein [Candidatus Igneacidithiobacillus taiwanensis]|uniref:Card1-like endonuclease domain-containing protein n=1 Tax=Candidatus Igneacidithiobacillus taiwanensis TaxID=1945924 RepID=UPI00289E35B7|nr:DUF1887 family CARF protein [Candidatus Igneacidithiobacillus taiwanensis]MCE5360042.1 DUF1887 family protein [Acidithiobacillus sp.]
MQPKFATHLVLVSDQPVPSLLPLLDPDLGAQSVLLVATPARQRHAQHLAEALRSTNLEVSPVVILEQAYDITYLYHIFRQLIANYPANSVAANISGGNKLMSIAAYEVCKENRQGIYYINIETDSVQWIYPQHSHNHPLRAPLRLENYLHACGVELESISRPDTTRAWLHIARELLRDSKLRSYVYHLLHNPDAMPNYLRDRANRIYLPQLVNAKLISKHADNLIPYSKDAKAFLGGLWLEILVYELLQEHSKNIQDIAHNLKVRWLPDGASESVFNEFDIAVLSQNTLILVECKSGSTKTHADELRKVIFQLGRSRQKLGGLRGKAVLISLHELSASLVSRCQDNGVVPITGNGISDLRAKLIALIEGEHP